MRTHFIEKNLIGSEPARCVDGRPCADSLEGPQMLGGSLHPLVLNAIFTNTPLDSAAVQEGLSKLAENDFAAGVHTGSHEDKNSNICDCGFCDRLSEIVSVAIENEDEIKSRLKLVFEENGFESNLIDSAYKTIRRFDTEKIIDRGEPLLLSEIDNGAICETVEGEHAEEIVYVNLKENTTFDTRQANQEGFQAFNLDLWMVIRQAQALGIESNFSIPASLILYQATEMVLVEQKGSDPLPVAVNQ
jgi:hypothetical protein